MRKSARGTDLIGNTDRVYSTHNRAWLPIAVSAACIGSITIVFSDDAKHFFMFF